MNSTIVEYIEGIEVIKAFGRAGTSYEKYSKAILDYKKFVVKWLSSTWITMKLTFALFPSTILGTLPVGLYLTIRGRITISELLLAVMLSMSMVTSFAKIEVFMENIREMKFNIESIEGLLNMRTLPQPEKRVDLKSHDIVMSEVHFSYTGDQKDEVLHGIDLAMPEGSYTALVGPSGGGKSTVAKLISRFWDVTEGSITIGGVNVKDMPLQQLSEMVSFVTQDNFLFRCSILENIRLGDPNATDEQVKEAARKACCEEFIKKLPMGYDTPAGEAGKCLSGGEKQKIAFSSVYASAPDVLVFDEPSSNLDMKAIGELADLIQRAKISGKTILIAEHRIWYLMDIVDRVVYMQDGRIASDMEASAFKALPEADIRRMGLRVRDLSVSESGGVKTIAADGLLSAQKISVRLGGRNVLNDISFQACRGEIIAIAGVNGAGKSTLARMLCGLQKNGSGTVLWAGKPMSRRLRRKKAYMVMQDVGHQLFTDSVSAECALGIKAPNKDEIDRTLEKVDLLAYKERHPLSLSGGQMQRLAVVVSDICGKELLVFDEPTSGLDLKSMEEVGILTRSLATQGKVLLIITHDIEFMMRICTRILFIRDGEIVEDLSGGQKEKIVRLLRGEE